MKPLSSRRLWVMASVAAISGGASASMTISFNPVDAKTKKPVAGEVEVFNGSDLVGRYWSFGTGTAPVEFAFGYGNTSLDVPAGATIGLQQDGQPVQEIHIVVRASRIVKPQPPSGSSGVVRTSEDLNKFINTTSGDSKQLVKGQSGVAQDSAGQAHIRGEHADISYYVDGVPLPDTLAGGQGSVVVPSTIKSLDLLTGGYAPEFGGQTAGILDITTFGGADKLRFDSSVQGGSYKTFNTVDTLQGPIGPKANFILNVGATRTDDATEPLQPGVDTAHNQGSSRSYFGNLRFRPSKNDTFTLTLSQNPDALQINNRTGLPSYFAGVGEGYGFGGLRNADGSRPDVNSSNSGTVGSGVLKLQSQQQDGQDIDQDEVSEFFTLNYHHTFDAKTDAQLAFTELHSGQDLRNNNPLVDPNNLPVDNSIEYNPTVSRNVHHVQLEGSSTHREGAHRFKGGFVYDSQSGQESYNITADSQLALDALEAYAPTLAPVGTLSSAVDVNGNKVYSASGASPTLNIKREGYYAAAYGQDSWKLGKLIANYGLRADWYRQSENLGQAPVYDMSFSPRVNLSYQTSKITNFRASFNRLVNAPPLAQGAVVGAAIKPEKLNQYDLGVTHSIGHGQSLELAYYYKDIRNQVDTGLLIPGSEIGLFQSVNFDRGAIHGIETSYDISPKGGIGWDGYFNYSYSVAKPEGFDSTGAPVPEYNDHDQRHTVGLGIAYTAKSGFNSAVTFQYGSGLASSVVYNNQRVQRHEIDFRMSTGNVLFGHHAALTLDIENLEDERTVINFDSAFSGTRFMQGRRILLGIDSKF